MRTIKAENGEWTEVAEFEDGDGIWITAYSGAAMGRFDALLEIFPSRQTADTTYFVLSPETYIALGKALFPSMLDAAPATVDVENVIALVRSYGNARDKASEEREYGNHDESARWHTSADEYFAEIRAALEGTR